MSEEGRPGCPLVTSARFPARAHTAPGTTVMLELAHLPVPLALRWLQWPLPESQHPHPHFPIKGRRAAPSSPDTCQVDHLHLLQGSFRVGLCLGSADPLLHKQGLAQPNTLPN